MKRENIFEIVFRRRCSEVGVQGTCQIPIYGRQLVRQLKLLVMESRTASFYCVYFLQTVSRFCCMRLRSLLQSLKSLVKQWEMVNFLVKQSKELASSHRFSSRGSSATKCLQTCLCTAELGTGDNCRDNVTILSRCRSRDAKKCAACPALLSGIFIFFAQRLCRTWYCFYSFLNNRFVFSTFFL